MAPSDPWIRIAKLAGMLGSPHDAERLTAMRKVEAALKAAGLTWADMVRRIGTGPPASLADGDDDEPVAEPYHGPQPPWHRPVPRWQGDLFLAWGSTLAKTGRAALIQFNHRPSSVWLPLSQISSPKAFHVGDEVEFHVRRWIVEQRGIA